MEQVVVYAAVADTLLLVRDATNTRGEGFPWLMRGVPVTLKIRLFNGLDDTSTYPVGNFSSVSSWLFAIDTDFSAGTDPKIIGDSESIELATITETIGGVSRQMTELTIPITQMDSELLTAAIGERITLPGMVAEISGYNSADELIWSRQIEGANVRNRVAPLPENAYYKTFPRITTVSRSSVVWSKGVPLYDTDLDQAYIGDGITSGGKVLGGGSELEPRVTALESGVFVSGGTQTSAAVLSSIVYNTTSGNSALYTMASAISGSVTTLSGSVEVLSGYFSSGGTSAHFVDHVSGSGFSIGSGAVVNSAYVNGGTAFISGGTVKNLEVVTTYDMEEESATYGDCVQRGGTVSAVFAEGEGDETANYYMSGGNVLLFSAGGSAYLCLNNGYIERLLMTSDGHDYADIYGGVVAETVIMSDCTVNVHPGATISNVTIDGGTLTVGSGGSAYGIHYISGTYVSGGETIIEN